MKVEWENLTTKNVKTEMPKMIYELHKCYRCQNVCHMTGNTALVTNYAKIKRNQTAGKAVKQYENNKNVCLDNTNVFNPIEGLP